MTDTKREKPVKQPKAAPVNVAQRQSMTADEAKRLGLDPAPYGKAK